MLASLKDSCSPRRNQIHAHPDRSLPQSSSASRFTAGASGFIILSQSGERAPRAGGAGLGDTDDTKRYRRYKKRNRRETEGVYAFQPMMSAAQPEAKSMADNFKNRGALDRSRVSMDDQHGVRYWTETIGCSKDELAAAVARVGNSSQAVWREVYRHWAYGTVRRDSPPAQRPRGRPSQVSRRQCAHPNHHITREARTPPARPATIT